MNDEFCRYCSRTWTRMATVSDVSHHFLMNFAFKTRNFALKREGNCIKNDELCRQSLNQRVHARCIRGQFSISRILISYHQVLHFY